jgi:hypothetical protein
MATTVGPVMHAGRLRDSASETMQLRFSGEERRRHSGVDELTPCQVGGGTPPLHGCLARARCFKSSRSVRTCVHRKATDRC